MDNITDPENTIIMEVKGGNILIELLPILHHFTVKG